MPGAPPPPSPPPPPLVLFRLGIGAPSTSITPKGGTLIVSWEMEGVRIGIEKQRPPSYEAQEFQVPAMPRESANSWRRSREHDGDEGLEFEPSYGDDRALFQDLKSFLWFFLRA